MQLLAPGPAPCPECGGGRVVDGVEYDARFAHIDGCRYLRTPQALVDVGARRLAMPHIQNWLLEDVRPVIDEYLARTGVRPTRLLIAPRFAPLFNVVAKILGIDVVADLRCQPGRLYVVGPDWDGRLE
jgi:hypothetical protein